VLFRHHVNNVGEVSVRRSRNGLRDLLAQQSCITVSTRMEPTGQCDEKSIAQRIDPEQGSGVSGVTIGVGPNAVSMPAA
jgi:hypothetical protein